MKETWYGDKRDLLKWSVVLELCRQHGIETAFYVAMLTRSTTGQFTIDGEQFPVSEPVWQHFRSLRHLERLFGTPKLRVFDEDFTHRNRSQYFERAISDMRSLQGRKMVLLDPDTGLAPQNASEQHIRIEECQLVWNALEAGDLLLLYQHSWRDGNWKKHAADRLLSALGGAAIMQAEAPEFASDVILLGAKKGAN